MIPQLLKQDSPIVNSYNEWDPLEEVIVGSGIPSELPAIEFTFKLFFHDNIYDVNECDEINGYIKKHHIDEHNEDVEGFVDLLKQLSVKVQRPKIPKHIYKVKTPYWESVVHPALNVRDQCMIIGDMIVETPPTCRWRYFENDYMKHLFLDYMKQGAKWIQCPKPIMMDRSFDLSYVSNTPGAQEHYENCITNDDHYMNCGHEIMFDGANAMRLGKHILINCSNKNQELGIQWLQNMIGDTYTILPAPICDSHIDSSFLPLRPGVAVVTTPEVEKVLPEQLKKWDLIYIPDTERTSGVPYKDEGIKLASSKIQLNVFSINPNLIICHPEFQRALSEKLKKYKIEVIPSQIRHCEIFAGAHHCITLDVRRKGTLENYLD